MPYYQRWPSYVSVGHRQAGAKREMDKLRKKGIPVSPIERIKGRKIAQTFWGEAWCKHLETFSDYSNRLPRGRSYVRNGSVCHLQIEPGHIRAYVSGSDLYEVDIAIKPMPQGKWDYIRKSCTGQIGSLLELLQGRFSKEVMAVVTDRDDGLFPLPGEITFSCSCPDWAVMCKHVAAVLYGVGARLDTAPAMLFQLRGLDHEELLSGEAMAAATAAAQGTSGRRRIKGDLSEVFGFEMDTDDNATATGGVPATRTSGSKGRKRPAPANASPANPKGKRAPASSRAAKPSATPAPTETSPEMAKAYLDTLTGDALQEILDAAEVGVDLFARLLGVSRITVRNWLGRGVHPIGMYKKSRQSFDALLEPATDEMRGAGKWEFLRAHVGDVIRSHAEAKTRRVRRGSAGSDVAGASPMSSSPLAPPASRSLQRETLPAKKPAKKTTKNPVKKRAKTVAKKTTKKAATKASAKTTRSKNVPPTTSKAKRPGQRSPAPLPPRQSRKTPASPQAKAPNKTRSGKAASKPKRAGVATNKRPTPRTPEASATWTGADIAALRERLGLSVAAFARKLGVTPQSIYGWEKNAGALSLHAYSQSAIAALAAH